MLEKKKPRTDNGPGKNSGEVYELVWAETPNQITQYFSSCVSSPLYFFLYDYYIDHVPVKPAPHSAHCTVGVSTRWNHSTSLPCRTSRHDAVSSIHSLLITGTPGHCHLTKRNPRHTGSQKNNFPRAPKAGAPQEEGGAGSLSKTAPIPGATCPVISFAHTAAKGAQ